jgi:hypothetical protein
MNITEGHDDIFCPSEQAKFHDKEALELWGEEILPGKLAPWQEYGPAYKYILSRVQHMEGTVLDVGTGNGFNLMPLSTVSDFDAHATDPDLRQEEMIYSHRRIFPDRPGKPLWPSSDFRPSFKSAPVKIGNRVWVGANVIILKGVEIGDDAVIGAGSVVVKNIPARTIAADNPARIVH